MRLDPHSFADASHPIVHRLDWTARIDVTSRVLACEALLTFEAPGEGPLDLDTRELEIDSVTTAEGVTIPFVLGPRDAVLGTPLRIALPPATRAVRIRYRTSPEASALQWLPPSREGGQPFLFSQCQAIHARSLVPLQDTPGRRITFHAQLELPASLRALMAAGFVRREERGETATETWEMPQPIAPYLFAFAAGELVSRDLGPRSRVWSEPHVIEQAAWEFASVDEMLRVGESLFGAYDWDRFDLLVMPASFPYGGMENPRLTFLTPSLLAGDRSLVNVVAHELAHSWTGNLVTNANAEHFWLNEGWTVWAERRIVEALDGRDRSELDAALGRRTLEKEFERFGDRPALTHLRTHLDGVDPDEAFSSIPYEKGYLFLRRLEEHVGRDRFDAFVRSYLATFRFRSLTTDDFLAFVEKELPGALEAIGASRWIDQPLLPPDAPRAVSTRLAQVEAIGAWVPTPEEARDWTPAEWQLFLARLPTPAPPDLCAALEASFALTASSNLEVLVQWLSVAIASGHPGAAERACVVLGEIGRMKFLRPLYKALHDRAETRALARDVFRQQRDRYHPIARQLVGGIIEA